MPAPLTTTKQERGWTADVGRRRSMRVLLSVPVIVHGKTRDQRDFHEETRTLVVNAHGALLSVATPLAAGQRITIEHKLTQETLDCRIIYAGNPQGGKSQMGVEFVSPSPTFWRIDFPPDDWVAPEN